MKSRLTADQSAVDDPHFRNEHTIAIAARPAAVFPWLAQMGFGRAGWYSWDLIDNLGRRSATTLHPEWMVQRAGDSMPGGPITFDTLVVDKPRRLTIAVLDRSLGPWTFDFVLDYTITPVATGSNLTATATGSIAGPLGAHVAQRLLGPGDSFMVRKQLREVRKRAEAGPSATT